MIEYSDKCSKTSEILWQYNRDEPNHSFRNCESFTTKTKIKRYTAADGNQKAVEIIMSLQHLRKIWRTLDMPLINCEVTLNLTWVATCVNTNFKDTRTFAINQTKLFLPVVTLST